MSDGVESVSFCHCRFFRVGFFLVLHIRAFIVVHTQDPRTDVDRGGGLYRYGMGVLGGS